MAKTTTPAQVAPDRNARRREMYAQNDEYRQKQIEASRKTYRDERGVEMFSCLDRLSDLDSYGERRTAILRDATGSEILRLEHELTFTMRELAELLGYAMPVVYRWKSRGLLPAPLAYSLITILKGKCAPYDTWATVYLEGEVEEIVKIIGTHQQSVRYFRTTDTETIDALKDALAAVRDKRYGVEI